MSRMNMFDVIRQRNMAEVEEARNARANDPTYNRIPAPQMPPELSPTVEHVATTVATEVLGDPEHTPIQEEPAPVKKGKKAPARKPDQDATSAETDSSSTE